MQEALFRPCRPSLRCRWSSRRDQVPVGRMEQRFPGFPWVELKERIRLEDR